MASGQLKIIAEWKDFTAGEYGTLGGQQANAKAFTARNVVRYRDGSLGPRAGLLDLAPSGLASGVIAGMTWPRAVGSSCVFVQGTAVRGFPADQVGGAVHTYSGALSLEPTKAVDFAYVSGNLYMVSYGDGLYKLDVDDRIVTKLTSAPSGRSIALYGERLLIGGIPGAPNRFRYSEAADFDATTSWPSTNFIDIAADNVEIRGLYAMRDFLVIVGQDLSVYVFTGVPGINETLRRVVTYPVGENKANQHLPSRAAMDLTATRLWIVGQHAPIPVRFNGAKIENASALEFADDAHADDALPPPFGAAAIQESEEMILAGARSYAALRREGVWTLHTFDVPVYGLVAADSSGLVLLSDGGGPTTAPKFYSMHTALDRPVIKGLDFASVGDASDNQADAVFTLPEKWVDAGVEFKPAYLVLDFESFDTRVAEENLLRVELKVFGSHNEQYQPVVLRMPQWTEPPGKSELTGSRRSVVYPVEGDDARPGRGFALTCTVRGVKVKMAQLVAREEAARFS